jgi:hypothetical protein
VMVRTVNVDVPRDHPFATRFGPGPCVSS